MTKICLIDSWPNLERSAEKEFIRRAVIAGNELGMEVYQCTTSSEVECIKPDLVLPCHEYTAKLTPYPTLGAMWSPPEFFQADKIRERSILSYDGYLIGSRAVGNYIDDLFCQIRTGPKPVSDFYFLPSSQDVQNPRVAGSKRSLVYSGVHWDGLRHGELFYSLTRLELINLYGPREAWLHVDHAYRGEIAFDGTSMLTAIAEHGCSLCLHKASHIRANTPSMRLFEALAAGSLIITDEIDFARQEFGDTLFYLDAGMTTREKTNFIAEKLEWARVNPLKADDMANAAKEIFSTKWSLQALLPKVVEFTKSVSTLPPYPLSQNASHKKATQENQPLPKIDVIIRAGGRPLLFLKRAIETVTNQTLVDIRIIIVAYQNQDEVFKTAKRMYQNIKCVNSSYSGFRSTALWDGLKEVRAPYFCVLDDDDTISPNHLRILAHSLIHCSAKGELLSYSGVLRIEEDGYYIKAINFEGPGGSATLIKETKELKFMDKYDPERLVLFDNYIQSNAWLASSKLLDMIDLSDPRLEVAEDMYLYIQFLSVSDFLFVPVQTANWHWRSKARGNSMLSVNQETWMDNHGAMLNRLKNLLFKNGITYKSMRFLSMESQKQHAPEGRAQDTIVLPVNSMNNILETHFDQNQRAEGFHPVEKDGVWTSSEFAWLQAYSELPTKSVEYNFELMTPEVQLNGTKENFNHTKILINGISVYECPSSSPWEKIKIEGKVDLLQSTNSIVIIITSQSLFEDHANERHIGSFLGRIGIRILPSNQGEEKTPVHTESPEEKLPSSFYLSRALFEKSKNNISGMLENVNAFLAEHSSSGRPISENQQRIVGSLLNRNI